MAQEGNTALGGSFWRELFGVGVYKRTQGRIARNVTFGALAVMSAFAAYSLKNVLINDPLRYVYAGVLLLVGLWLSYRVVQTSRFADFLIAVEAEMNKVSWPTRSELYRSVIVVLLTLFGLAGVIFGFDLLWRLLLGSLGITGTGGG